MQEQNGQDSSCDNNLVGTCRVKCKIERVIAAAILAIGIAFSGYFVGNAFLKSKSLNRNITVKGLSEKEVISNLAIWPITIKATGNNLTEVNKKIESDHNMLVSFLIEQGFKKEEIDFGNYAVTDLLAQSYRNNNSEEYRYIITSTTTLKTSNVALAQKVTKLQNLLVQRGIALGSEGYNPSDYNGPSYIFTKFNDIKPAMLEEAIRNARKSAEKFAVDSGNKQ
ncbi:SIMPL domain-containing protein [Rickettsia conorii]|uniref:SIMPL domain-containing protein n=1 Tax=Rickettsia conorii TaxID=781 RepID=UPI003AF19FF0